MQNPFESGHIKNYIMLYASVVLIMVLFFIATTLFHDVEDVEKKVFKIQSNKTVYTENKEEEAEEKNQTSRFKLLDKVY